MPKIRWSNNKSIMIQRQVMSKYPHVKAIINTVQMALKTQKLNYHRSKSRTHQRVEVIRETVRNDRSNHRVLRVEI